MIMVPRRRKERFFDKQVSDRHKIDLSDTDTITEDDVSSTWDPQT